METLNVQKLIERLYQIRKERRVDATLSIISVKHGHPRIICRIPSILNLKYADFVELSKYEIENWSSTDETIVIIVK